MEKLIQFVCVVLSGVVIAGFSGDVSFYSNFIVMQNDMKHIKDNIDMMRSDNALIIKNYESRMRDVELKLAKKTRDERKKS